MTDSLKELAKGFRKRTLVTAKLAGKMGLKMARRQIGGRLREPSPREVEQAVGAARELVLKLGHMKGLVMKVGQMASYLPGALPDEAQRVLGDLQAQSTAMAYERVAEVIEAELGASPDALFDDFEREPFAAASIGQVHRARVDGRRVAVKVQYPGIEEVLASDLSTIGAIAKISTLGLPMDGAAIVHELETRILEECDYELEARHQKELAALLAEDPDASVPDVIDARSSRRVLTTAFVDGQRFAPFADGADQRAKDRAGEVIFRTCFRCLFVHGVYNGDPHPGNYLFDAEGRVTFLDFGCVRRFDERFIETWKALARTILDDDRARFPEHLKATGLVGRERTFDWDHQWACMQYLYRPFIQTDPYMTYDEEYVKESYGVLLFDNPNQRKMGMPPEWLLTNRLQWGLNAVLAKLRATAPWPEHFRAAATAPFRGTERGRSSPVPSVRDGK